MILSLFPCISICFVFIFHCCFVFQMTCGNIICSCSEKVVYLFMFILICLCLFPPSMPRAQQAVPGQSAFWQCGSRMASSSRSSELGNETDERFVPITPEMARIRKISALVFQLCKEVEFWLHHPENTRVRRRCAQRAIQNQKLSNRATTYSWRERLHRHRHVEIEKSREGLYDSHVAIS